ncbi:uncharacterized protein LOC143666059 [Tamandua tetradactyla]|uniref:uncharacterized protein LOC143666059 n=1 Tax=Tamandua tetradactyla TaxID=48850 RepID=UPI0040544118
MWLRTKDLLTSSGSLQEALIQQASGIKPRSPALQARTSPAEPPWPALARYRSLVVKRLPSHWPETMACCIRSTLCPLPDCTRYTSDISTTESLVLPNPPQPQRFQFSRSG